MRFRGNWIRLYAAETCPLPLSHTPASIGVTAPQFGCWDATALDTVQIVAIEPTEVWCRSNGLNRQAEVDLASGEAAIVLRTKSLSLLDGSRFLPVSTGRFFGSILEENGGHPCSSSRTFIRKLYTNAD